MRVPYPMLYDVTGRLPDKKIARRYGYIEWMELEIPDVAVEDAPVAASWRQASELRKFSDLPRGSNQGRSDPDGRRHTRWYAGRHWKQLLSADVAGFNYQDREFHPRLDAELLAGYLERGDAHTAIGTYIDNNVFSTARAVPGDPASGFATVKSSTRQRALDSLVKAEGNLIAVEGVVYRACLEPFLAMTKAARPGTTFCDIVVETEKEFLTSEIVTSRHVLFPLKHYDHVVAVSSAQTAPARCEAWFADLKPEVFIEDAFCFDWPRYAEVTALLLAFSKHASFGGDDLETRARQILHEPDAEARHAMIVDVLNDFEGVLAKNRLLGFLDQARSILDERRVALDLDPVALSGASAPDVNRS
jgi:hypothetical protein